MAELATDGYTLLPGVLDTATQARLRDAVESAVALGGDAVQVRAGTVWIRDVAVLGDHVDQLAAMPAVVAAVTVLLGPDPIRVGAVMRNPVGETAHQALHVDWAGPVAPGHDQQAQAMFFLDDATHDNGPTRIVPGTHRSGAVPPRHTADPRSRHPEEVTVHARAGDVLVFSSHTWHSGTANRSGRPRRVVTVSYGRGGG